MKKLVWLVLILAGLLLTVSCAEESATTAPTTTQTPMETTPTQTTPITTKPIVTSTHPETTAPETTPDTAWKAKIEDDFYEKAVEEDGKYYTYLTYNFGYGEYAVRDNQTFVDAYVADKKDIVFANLESGMISQGIYLRATAEEIEAYAKNYYVTGIYSYPHDKIVEGCKATINRMDVYLMMDAMFDMANGGGSLPLVKINSKEELVAFADACILDNRPVLEEMGMIGIQSSRETFDAMTAIYDDAYFAEKTLFLIGSENSTGSERYSLIHVLADQGVQIVLEMTCPVVITHDMAWWLIFIEVDNSAIQDQTTFEVIVK